MQHSDNRAVLAALSATFRNGLSDELRNLLQNVPHCALNEFMLGRSLDFPRSAFHDALASGDVERTRIFLDFGAPVDSYVYVDTKGEDARVHPLAVAALAVCHFGCPIVDVVLAAASSRGCLARVVAEAFPLTSEPPQLANIDTILSYDYVPLFGRLVESGLVQIAPATPMRVGHSVLLHAVIRADAVECLKFLRARTPSVVWYDMLTRIDTPSGGAALPLAFASEAHTVAKYLLTSDHAAGPADHDDGAGGTDQGPPDMLPAAGTAAETEATLTRLLLAERAAFAAGLPDSGPEPPAAPATPAASAPTELPSRMYLLTGALTPLEVAAAVRLASADWDAPTRAELRFALSCHSSDPATSVLAFASRHCCARAVRALLRLGFPAPPLREGDALARSYRGPCSARASTCVGAKACVAAALEQDAWLLRRCDPGLSPDDARRTAVWELDRACAGSFAHVCIYVGRTAAAEAAIELGGAATAENIPRMLTPVLTLVSKALSRRWMDAPQAMALARTVLAALAAGGQLSAALKGTSALASALSSGRLAFAQLLLDAGADVFSTERRNLFHDILAFAPPPPDVAPALRPFILTHDASAADFDAAAARAHVLAVAAEEEELLAAWLRDPSLADRSPATGAPARAAAAQRVRRLPSHLAPALAARWLYTRMCALSPARADEYLAALGPGDDSTALLAALRAGDARLACFYATTGATRGGAASEALRMACEDGAYELAWTLFLQLDDDALVGRDGLAAAALASLATAVSSGHRFPRPLAKELARRAVAARQMSLPAVAGRLVKHGVPAIPGQAGALLRCLLECAAQDLGVTGGGEARAL